MKNFEMSYVQQVSVRTGVVQFSNSLDPQVRGTGSVAVRPRGGLRSGGGSRACDCLTDRSGDAAAFPAARPAARPAHTPLLCWEDDMATIFFAASPGSPS